MAPKIKVLPQEQYLVFCAFLHFIVDALNMNKSVLERKLKQQNSSLCDGFKYLLIKFKGVLFNLELMKVYIYCIFIRN